MRNLKKLFAVLLVVAMIASMMVPALAANYEAEGIKLQTIGLVAGGPEDLGLDREMKRIEAVAFVIRAAGKESEALAMTDEEVEAILADWTDAADIPSWNGNGLRYAAYAIKNGIVKGVSTTEKIFAPNALVKGIDFLVLLMKSALGYADVNVNPDSENYVVEAAINAGILPAGKVVTIASKAALVRDDTIYILYNAVMSGVNADGTKLIDALIASGAVDAAKAAEAGFVDATPATLEALSATATNLKEIVVTFNGALDADSAKNKDNYSVADKTIKSVRVNEDKKSVTIELDDTTIMANQSEFKVTVKTGVKNAAGVALAEDVELTGEVFDVTIPVALSAEQSGPSTFKVRFSEPVKANANNFKVDGGTYFIKDVASADNAYTVEIELYTTIPNGEHKVEVTGVEDYAGYKNVTKTLTFVAAKDEVAPAVAKVISASPEKVELEMTEDVFFVTNEATAKSKIYHTNSANTPDGVSIEGNKVTLTFTTSKLPNGTAYLTIDKDLFKDAWGNKNAKVEDLALTVTVDKVKPTVKNIKAENDKTIVIEFSENVTVADAKYTILDSTGKDVTKDYTITKTFDGKTKVTLSFNKALSGSTYSVVIEGVKDLAGNEIEKVAPTVTVTDTTPPEIVKAEIYKNKNAIKVVFNEVMKAEDLLNLANYMLGGKDLIGTKVTATLTDNGKGVMLDYSKADTATFDAYTQITIGRVRDAAGNYMADFATTKTLTDVDVQGVLIDSVEATGEKTLVVTLKDSLAVFEPADFLIKIGSDDFKAPKDVAESMTFANNDGKGVITFTLKNKLDTDLNDEVFVKTIDNAADIKSKNNMDVKVKDNQTPVKAKDKIPANITAAFTTANAITITFSEEVEKTTLSKATFTVSGNTVTSVTIAEDGKSMTLTLKDAVSIGTKVTITQVVDFEDKEGNVSKGLEVKDVEYNTNNN